MPGVAGDLDPRRLDPLPQQIAPRLRRRAEVQRGHLRDQPSVHLLRPRRVRIPGAQPRLDMRHRQPRMRCRQRRREGRTCVALHQHPVGPQVCEYLVHPRQYRGRQAVQPRPVPHQVQIAVRPNGKAGQNLVQHRAVLGRHADQRRQARGLSHAPKHRRHFDRLRAGPEDRQNAHAVIPAVMQPGLYVAQPEIAKVFGGPSVSVARIVPRRRRRRWRVSIPVGRRRRRRRGHRTAHRT